MRDVKGYTDLVVPEHQRPNFIAWLTKNLGNITDIAGTIVHLDTDFDLDSAIGDQLDILGDIVGRKRLLDFQPSMDSSILDDDMYRLCIKAKIAINMWNGETPDVYDHWSVLFSDYALYIHDNQDMSMNVYILGHVPQLMKELTEHYYVIPKPEGVRINLFFDLKYDDIPHLPLNVGVYCDYYKHWIIKGKDVS
jgi:hypothetical protein